MRTMCFLLEHATESGVEHVLFDCGSRKDFWNGSPKSSSMIGGHVAAVQVEHGVDEVLALGGFDVKSLRAVIWSHWHWDHIGDGSKFAPQTDIVVGPGFTESFLPGWPENSSSFVLARDIESHRVHEPEFPLQIAGFAAHDYFGDGSFYLLEVPGHAIGHICGFARTTPNSFVFMGGDCCHFAGMFRPSPSVPLPSAIEGRGLDPYFPRLCPCFASTSQHEASRNDRAESHTRGSTSPLYDVSEDPGSAYSDKAAAQRSITKLQDLDAHPEIFICLAHENALFDVLPLFNREPQRNINEWKAKGYKEAVRWAFLNELPRNSKPGREPLVTGKWNGDREITWTEESGWSL